MQSRQVFRLFLSERQQAKQPVGMKPGLEDSPLRMTMSAIL